MIVVSDTGPLNYLTIIGYVKTLPKLYGEVVIPPAVADELTRPQCAESVRDLIESLPSWLRIVRPSVSDSELGALGEGEQQAILLAVSLRADLLLCDDKDAREAARQKNLCVIGTLAVLQEAAENGLLDLTEALSRLRDTNFRMTRSLIDRILEEHRRS